MTDAFTTLLAQLADESRPARSIDLTQLSDLGRSQLQEAHSAWLRLSPDRRCELMALLVEQAEADIHVNYHALLRSCLSDADARVRKLAVEGLWEDEKVSLIPPLSALLAADAEAAVRAAAAISLGRFVLLGVLGEIDSEPARVAEDALLAAWYRVGEANEVRRRALEGLAYTDAAGLPELISSAYYDEDAGMRQSALFAMGRSADPRWARIVLAELGSAEPAMRFEAAAAAGEMGLARAVQPLIGRLDDPDGSVREAAVVALGRIGGPVARRALQAVLDGQDERLAEAAEEALDELRFNSERLDEPLVDYPERHSVVARADQDEDSDDFGDEGAEEEDADDFFGAADDLDLYGEEMLGDEEDGGDDFDFDGADNDLDWEDEDSDDEEWR